MAHNYQKRWVFIWNADENDKLIDSRELENLMNKIVKEGVFQLEKRKETGRRHYQGRFELKGPRTGKKRLLKLFSTLSSVKNLTFQQEISYDSSVYCTKADTRIAGPWFIGVNSYKTKNSKITLHRWQEQLLSELIGPLGSRFRDMDPRSERWIW